MEFTCCRLSCLQSYQLQFCKTNSYSFPPTFNGMPRVLFPPPSSKLRGCEPQNMEQNPSSLRSLTHCHSSSSMALKVASAFSLPPSSIRLFSPNPIKSSLIPKARFVVRSSQVQQQEEQIPFTEPENSLIDALIGIQGRGRSASPQQLDAVQRAVQVLEGSGGVPDPTNSSLIEGRWQLMFTTRPGTASPIQRTFVGVDFFSVFQEVYLRTSDPRVSNIVTFSDALGELKVEAAASIENGKRILFRFDRAAFSFKFLPFKVPYPVPFKLLGDEAKGWLDTTYLSHSGNLRISRGNKGTTFVLQKNTEPRQRLLSAISSGQGIEVAIDELISLGQTTRNDEPELQEGEWLMIWSSQSETDSWLENAANGLMGKQIIRNNGQIKFVVNILPGFKFSMNGNYNKTGSKMYDVTMDDAAIIGGPFGYPIGLETKFVLELLYNDEKIRISRGFKKFLFVHIRIDGSTGTLN